MNQDLLRMMSTNLDALSEHVTETALRANQSLSVLLGAGLLLYLLLQGNEWDITPQAVVLSLLGGMISPFAKDIVSALAGLRRKGT